MKPLVPLPTIMLEPLLRAALLEDLGRAGDLTTDAIVPKEIRASTVLAARQRGVVAGLDLAVLAFKLIDQNVEIEVQRPDGSSVVAGDVVATVNGPARAVVTAERTALNFLSARAALPRQRGRSSRPSRGTRQRSSAWLNWLVSGRSVLKHNSLKHDKAPVLQVSCNSQIAGSRFTGAAPATNPIQIFWTAPSTARIRALEMNRARYARWQALPDAQGPPDWKGFQSRQAALREAQKKKPTAKRWAQVARRRLFEHKPDAIPAGRRPEVVIQNPVVGGELR